MPDEWQIFEVQEGKDKSEKLPSSGLTSEAELAAQSGQYRRHCLNRDQLPTR